MTINMKLWETEASQIQRGHTCRFDHTDCPAGQDTRRRLYLTRPHGSPGIVLAFCHNCAEHGVLRDGLDKFRDFGTKKSSTHTESIPFKIPDGMEADPTVWPTVAKEWRVNKGLNEVQCDTSNIMYDPTTHRMYLPMFKEVGYSGLPAVRAELMGYQLRRLEGDDAKYLTALVDQDTKPYTRFGSANTEFCVLVEDLASGIILSAAAHNHGVSALVNYGIKVVPEILAANTNCDKNVVWLDNDSPKVHEQAKTIARTWALISGKRSLIERVLTDPKHYRSGDIHSAIQGWRQA